VNPSQDPNRKPVASPTPPIPSLPPVNNFPMQPLTKSAVEKPNPKPKASRSPWLRDIVGLAIFVVVVAVGAFVINTFIFRSFNVVGPSMEPTLDGGYGDLPNDRLIINLLPETWAHLQGKDWVPNRGDIIVFRNPRWSANSGQDDEYVVKRVVAFPGERVVVSDCKLKIYNKEHPEGFDPYTKFANLAENDKEVNKCVDGEGTDGTVTDGNIFVVGDHRDGNHSMDSRNGNGRSTLGLVPLKNIVGKVTLRIWPLDRLKAF